MPTSQLKTLNLTGDRPLKKRDAWLLKWWWEMNGFSCTISKQGRYYGVVASR